jgi:hypothetical protein
MVWVGFTHPTKKPVVWVKPTLDDPAPWATRDWTTPSGTKTKDAINGRT